MTKPKNKNKRSKPSSDSESEEQTNQSHLQSSPSVSIPSSSPSVTIPRFLVITSLEKDKPISSLSPFVICKTLKGIAGEPKSVKKLRSGDLLVECDKEAHIKNLLGTELFFNINCEVSLHGTLNSSRGTIRCPDLRGDSDEGILEEMRDQGVIAVRRIKVRRDGELKPTNTIILTFNTPVLPKVVKVGFLVVSVEVYIPNPLRCYKCQLFGHHENNCSRAAVCYNCGGSKHCIGTATCDRPAKCVNCSGNHSVNSRDCTAWSKEKEILKIKYSRNISFQEARKIIEAPTTPSGTSYASITKSASTMVEVVDASTQTNPVICSPVTMLSSFMAQQSSQSTNKTQNEVQQASQPTKDKTQNEAKQISKTTKNKTENTPKPTTKEKPPLKKATIEMIKKDMAKERQTARIQKSQETTRNRMESERAKGSKDPDRSFNSFSVLLDTALEEMEQDLLDETAPSIPKGKLSRIPIT